MSESTKPWLLLCQKYWSTNIQWRRKTMWSIHARASWWTYQTGSTWTTARAVPGHSAPRSEDRAPNWTTPASELTAQTRHTSLATHSADNMTQPPSVHWRPLPQTDIIRAVMIVWRVTGKIIRSVLCSILCNSCAQCNAHAYEQI